MATGAEPASWAGGRALVVAHGDLRGPIGRVMQGVGVVSDFVEEPYAAMGELCRRPLVYRVVVLSLQGVYQEELGVISAIKRRFPHLEVYLAHTDSRLAAMAEGMRLGADGVVSEQGIHRTGNVSGPPATTPPASVAPVAASPVAPPAAAEVAPPVARVAPAAVAKLDLSASEPLLTAEELRALLDDEPIISGGEA